MVDIVIEYDELMLMMMMNILMLNWWWIYVLICLFVLTMFEFMSFSWFNCNIIHSIKKCSFENCLTKTILFYFRIYVKGYAEQQYIGVE